MADTVKLTLSAHRTTKDDKGNRVVSRPGEEIEVDETEARRLIRAGSAVPSTVPEAKKVGASADTAATKS